MNDEESNNIVLLSIRLLESFTQFMLNRCLVALCNPFASYAFSDTKMLEIQTLQECATEKDF